MDDREDLEGSNPGLRYYYFICRKGLRKTTKDNNQNK
jgi:hypothetical protein